MIHIQSFTFNPFSENTYIVYNDQKSAFLLDPGNLDESETKLLHQFVEENALIIKNIVLTHAHIDHVLGLQNAYNTFRTAVLLHPLEKEILDRNPLDAKRFGFSFPAFEGETQFVEEGEKLFLEEEEFEILHLPGHSPGHIGLHHRNEKALLSGDVIFEGSIGRTDLYKGDYNKLLESIRLKIFSLNPETKIYPGHGNPTSVKFEKEFNPFF